MIQKLPQSLEGTGVQAVVTSLKTPNNLIGFNDEVSIGDEYLVYPGYMVEEEVFDSEREVIVKEIMIWADGNQHGSGGFIPIGCVEFFGKKKAIKQLKQVH